ncbi:hypothetical protein [Rhodanobacter sp. BL-MT-08]
MNDEPLDDLVRLYRKVAQEAPRATVDARILEIAGANRRSRAQTMRWSWLAGAIAAGVMIWLTARHSASAPMPVQHAASSVTPGYLDGRARAYLLQMDVAPPLSPSAQYLLTQNTSPE